MTSSSLCGLIGIVALPEPMEAQRDLGAIQPQRDALDLAHAGREIGKHLREVSGFAGDFDGLVALGVSPTQSATLK